MRVVLSLLLLFCFLSANAQTQQEVESIAKSYLERLDVIKANKEYETQYDSLVAINRRLEDFLREKGKNVPGILDYAFDSLHTYGSRVLTSDDQRVRIFSWDDRTGGTMRFYRSIFHFKTSTGVESLNLCDNADEENRVVCPLYFDLYSFKTNDSGTLYVGTERYVLTSGYGAFDVTAFKIANDTLLWGVPAFKTDTGMVSSISYEYDVSTGGPNPTYDGDLGITINKQKSVMYFPLIDQNGVIRPIVYYTSLMAVISFSRRSYRKKNERNMHRNSATNT